MLYYKKKEKRFMGNVNDLTGQRFGKLVAIKRVENNKHNKAQYLCRCDCGNETIVCGSVLKKGDTKSCGCLNWNNIIGKRFGKLVVVKAVDERRQHRICYLCHCDCGEEEIINGKYLINGTTKSCKKCATPHIKYDLTGLHFGEWTVENYAGKGMWNCICSCGTRKKVKGWTLKNGVSHSCGCLTAISATKRKIHGKTKTRLWVVWCGIKQRCFDVNHRSYKHYGERGITLCDEWLDFQNFYDWAIANGYDENAPKGDCTIDRINVNGNYEPSNCRWANTKVQAYNKTNTKYYDYKGDNYTLSELSLICGIKSRTIYNRLLFGWSVEKAVETPVKQSNKKFAIALEKELKAEQEKLKGGDKK
jgi:hypothetical protein